MLWTRQVQCYFLGGEMGWIKPSHLRCWAFCLAFFALDQSHSSGIFSDSDYSVIVPCSQGKTSSKEQTQTDRYLSPDPPGSFG